MKFLPVRNLCLTQPLTGETVPGNRRDARENFFDHCRIPVAPNDYLAEHVGIPHSWNEFIVTTSRNTVRLHRVFKATCERVYRAFLDPAAMVKWVPPHGFTGTVHEMDARVGGGYKMSFTNFGTGKSHSFGGKYVELIPGEKIRYTDRFDDPNLPGEMQVTITLKPVVCGTELEIVQAGIPEAIPVEFCYLGWQESLSLLANVVDPEIPDAP